MAKRLALGVLAAFVLFIAGCSSSGAGEAQKACTDVSESIQLYDHHDFKAARQKLEVALPYAAMANSENPRWNPLVTTLQESGTLHEDVLIPALKQQCALLTKPGDGLSVPGGVTSTH